METKILHLSYTSLTSLEQQQSYDDLLERSLGRLALAAQGLDPVLDIQLRSLRDVLRGTKSQQEIEKILYQMEKAIINMDGNSSNSNSQTAGVIIAKLLLSLKLNKQYKIEAKILAKRLQSTTNQAMSALTPEVLSFLGRALEHTPTDKSAGFVFSLFGKKKPSKEQRGLVHNSDNLASNNIPTHHVLIKLLERISLPSDLSKKATKIRHQIESGVDDELLPSIINEIADIMSDLGSQIVIEKHDYEEFLRLLSLRLNELDQLIRITAAEASTAFEQRKKIGQVVEEQLLVIHNEVEGAEDLDILKSTVTGHLDFLNQHFERYRQSDHDRFTQSQQQIKALNTRLEEMEQQSVELRESAEKSRNLALKMH